MLDENDLLNKFRQVLNLSILRISFVLRKISGHNSVKKHRDYEAYISHQLKMVQAGATGPKPLKKQCERRVKKLLSAPSARIAWCLLKAARHTETRAYRNLGELSGAYVAFFTQKDGEISMFSRAALEPPRYVDVAIVTSLRFPGGNASSTLDEIRRFTQGGLSVILIHCAINSNRYTISDRYKGYMQNIYSADSLKKISARLLVVRAPRVLLSESFSRIRRKVVSDQAAVIINNSSSRPDGSPIFEYSNVIAISRKIRAATKSIHPLGPAIRSEMEKLGITRHPLVSSNDWPPTFDVSSIKFRAKTSFALTPIIGRHGRDGKEKWLQDPKKLQAVYPTDNRFDVRMLGGAENAANVLGGMPGAWTVYPFGHKTPDEFLNEIDVFVYFPAEGLNEAFGRTIMEAVFAGTPCVVPPQFEETFGDLAFYCEYWQVRGVIERLATRDVDRQRFVTEARDIAERLYSSDSLLERAPVLRSEDWRAVRHRPSFSPESVLFKEWVEGALFDNDDIQTRSIEDSGIETPE